MEGINFILEDVKSAFKNKELGIHENKKRCEGFMEWICLKKIKIKIKIEVCDEDVDPGGFSLIGCFFSLYRTRQQMIARPLTRTVKSFISLSAKCRLWKLEQTRNPNHIVSKGN